MNWLQIIMVVAALVVLAEALNKLERADPFGGRRGLAPRLMGLAWLLVPWRWRRTHIVTVLKIIGWSLMAFGAAGHLAGLLFGRSWISADVAVLAGFATLIIRSRVKEG